MVEDGGGAPTWERKPTEEADTDLVREMVKPVTEAVMSAVQSADVARRIAVPGSCRPYESDQSVLCFEGLLGWLLPIWRSSNRGMERASQIGCWSHCEGRTGIDVGGDGMPRSKHVLATS